MWKLIAEEAPVLLNPPASPFAKLLRRSRFATYDPAIRQTYASPPANAHRGDWGLKRPIALRRKNAFISLTSFEHPAHFTEWNHAEHQVRFIRRIEEMGTMPTTRSNSAWGKGLGKARTQWLLDSDFCPGEMNTMEVEKKEIVDLSKLGRKGAGAYGAQRAAPPRDGQELHVTPNIDAMSRKEFVRYLRHLRTLRPAFKEHIQNLATDEREKHILSGKSLLALSQMPEVGYHRKFLKAHVAAEFNDPKKEKFEPQPHPNAALLYSHPTLLDSVLRTSTQPGIILNPDVPRQFTERTRNSAYVASFGGLTATLKVNDAAGGLPLLDVLSPNGIDQSKVDQSIIGMRIMRGPGGLVLSVPPRVVGHRPQGLKAVRINAQVTSGADHYSLSDRTQDNPNALGSPAYIAAGPRQAHAAPLDLARKKAPMNWNAHLNVKARKEPSGPILDTLKTMLSHSEEDRDKDL